MYFVCLIVALSATTGYGCCPLDMPYPPDVSYYDVPYKLPVTQAPKVCLTLVQLCVRKIDRLLDAHYLVLAQEIDDIFEKPTTAQKAIEQLPKLAAFQNGTHRLFVISPLQVIFKNFPHDIEDHFKKYRSGDRLTKSLMAKSTTFSAHLQLIDEKFAACSSWQMKQELLAFFNDQLVNMVYIYRIDKEIKKETAEKESEQRELARIRRWPGYGPPPP